MDYIYQTETLELSTDYKLKCNFKIKKENPEELWVLSNFIKISDEILKEYPLIFLKDLIEDYVMGITDKDIIKKYGFTTSKDFTNIFNGDGLFDFKSRRVTTGANSKKKNLMKSNFYQKYKQYVKACNFFEDELDERFVKNIIQGMIVLTLIESEKEIEEKDIINNMFEIFQKQKEKFPILKKQVLAKLVEKTISDNITELVQGILIDLINIKNFRTNFENNTHIISNIYKNLMDNVINFLEKETDGIRRDKLQNKIINEMPILKLIPNRAIFDKIYENLEGKKILEIEVQHANKSPQGDILFLINNFEQKGLQKDRVFFGRKNDPISFVYELAKLEKGDFDDKDDQVTRIAGLILTQSEMTSAPRDSLEEFDFVVNLDDFQPNPEQQKAMEKTDFKIMAKKIHVKVMINEQIKIELIKKIKNKINENEQAILISFKDCTGEVIQNTIDHRIQIVNKQSMLEWAKTIPYLPSRTGSIVKIKNGRYVGKIGRINSINYVTGTTTFSMIPDTGIDYNTKIGDLEEIELFESDNDNVEQIFENYAQFLKLVSNFSEQEIFERSLYNPKIGQIKILSEINSDEKEWSWSNTFEGVIAHINLKGKNNCTCDYWKTNEKKNYFCEHMISLLNSKAITEDFINQTWDKENILHIFLKNN